VTIHSHVFPNGLTLLAEPMPWLESASLALLMPAGCTHDPKGRSGLASLVAEMTQRGCGQRDSREFLEQLERLGVDASSSVAGAHTSFGGAMPAESLAPALAIYADLARRPLLPDDQLDDARQSCIQEVLALEDDLATRALHRLKARQYPDPWGRSSLGTVESLEAATIDDIRAFFESTYTPTQSILSIAGKFEWPVLQDLVAATWSDWARRDPPALEMVAAPHGYEHMPHESAQTQIWLAYDSIPYSHPDYYQARAAIGVLSDGMSSRLFTEVRENRGLCYSVSAFCHSLRDRGAVFGYAGTTNERAQETLDVMLGEFRKLAQGVTDAELSRLKAGLKSALIMQQESSAARAGAMASDWYHLGRVQTLEELGQIVDQLNTQQINAYLADHPPRDFTIVTLGNRPLEVSTP
jgi:predicted Zn-dependent peptidase